MGDLLPKYEREHRPPTVAELAAQQHGVITRAQLRGLGHSDSAIDGWVRTGRLHRVHRGVYAVGHAALSAEGRWMAAVLACGPGAVLSHRSAAALWGVRKADGGRVDVTVPRTRAGVRGIATYRSRRLDRDETTALRGIPVTTLPRTLADLADVLPEREHSRTVHEAEVVHSLAAAVLEAATRRANGRRGSGRLASVVTGERDRTRSQLERRFLRLCADHGIPPPEVNVKIAGLEVDFAWRAERVVVETDGWASHRTRRAFERDRQRDQILTRRGYIVIRFTWRQIVSDPAGVAETLRAALGARRERRR